MKAKKYWHTAEGHKQGHIGKSKCSDKEEARVRYIKMKRRREGRIQKEVGRTGDVVRGREKWCVRIRGKDNEPSKQRALRKKV